MSYVSDNFNAANGSLSANWAAVTGWSDISGGSTTGGIQLLNKAFAPSSSPGNAAYAAWGTGWSISSFGNNQWAQASIAAIAAFTSVVAITACSASGGVSTYTYTLTSGAALVVNQELYITGMQHSGNNSPTGGFQVTGLGSGTFTVANASPGANESGSSGTGNSPSDSICGIAVRCSAGGNAYVIQVGTNSSTAGNNGGASSDHRVYCVEIWKVVNGTATYLAGYNEGTLTTIPDAVGSVYTLTAVGSVLSVYKNGLQLIRLTDSSLTSGAPGIGTWSVSGAGEWANPTVYTTGNSGTQWTNFQGGDYSSANVPYFDDFIGTDTTDLHTYSSSWVENSGTFAIHNTTENYGVYGTTFVGSNALASWQGATFNNDQWAQTTIYTLATGNSVGPAVRVSASGNTGYFYRGSGATARVLYRINAGSYTLLGTGTTHTNAVGDVLKLVVIGSTLYCYVNGVLDTFGAITDGTPLTSGYPGIQGVTGCTSACFQCGNAGISGNVGVASAAVALTGAGSANVTADTNGNYSFPSLADGTYTVTPTKSGYTFTPSSMSVVLVGGTLYPSGENSLGVSSGGSGIGTVLTSGAATPTTVTNTNGVAQLITTPTVTSKLGQPTAIVFCDPNGNEYAITGSTAGAELEGPTPVVLCTTQGKAIAPTYTLTSNGNSIVVTATLTGTKRGQPVPVCISDPNGFAYITTGFASVGNYVANPTPICLTDQNGNVLTLTIGN